MEMSSSVAGTKVSLLGGHRIFLVLGNATPRWPADRSIHYRWGERICKTRPQRVAGVRRCIHLSCPPRRTSSIPRRQRWNRELAANWIPAGACHRARIRATGGGYDDIGTLRVMKRSRRRNDRDGFLDPHLVVVERGAADRRDGFGGGQHVDAAAADMGLVRVNRFRNQHTTPHALEQFRD